MIQHVVVAKFKEGTPQQEIDEIVAALRALPPRILEIRGYQVGLDVVHSARSYDFALVSTFDDLEAMERYRAHPDHMPVAQRLQAISQSSIVVDYDLREETNVRAYERVVQNAADKLLEDEQLRASLTDDEANVLIDWAVEWLEGRVASARDEATARQIALAEIARLRPAMQKINEMLADGKTPALPVVAQALGLPTPKVMASGLLDRTGIVRALTTLMAESWSKP